MFKAFILLLIHAVSAGLLVVVFEFHLAVACAVLAVATLVFWISAPSAEEPAEQREVEPGAALEPLDRPTTTSLAGL